MSKHSNMKFQNLELSKLLLPFLTIAFISIIPLCIYRNSTSPPPSSSSLPYPGEKAARECDIYTGKWVPNPKGPYYTNESCQLITDQQNCLRYGRPDTEFLKWRWRPEECELPEFDAVEFLEIVRGKKMAFVGDSVGRNQMQSLLCLLTSVSSPEDQSQNHFSDPIYFKWWYIPQYTFTLATFWSPFLVKARDADPNGHSLNSIMNLYLDQPDESWARHISDFDYVVVSAGNWFFRPLMHYINNHLVGCYNCNKNNVSDLTKYFGYRMAFRTTFKTLQSLKNYRGITFLRTFSPSHFENGAWNSGGSCTRTRPFTREEVKMEGYEMELYYTQVEEVKRAEKEGKNKRLKFEVLETTEAMVMRPDGHPNHYGYAPGWNKSISDCVHWCLPGPIDTWNEFLFYMLKKDLQTPFLTEK